MFMFINYVKLNLDAKLIEFNDNLFQIPARPLECA